MSISTWSTITKKRTTFSSRSNKMRCTDPRSAQNLAMVQAMTSWPPVAMNRYVSHQGRKVATLQGLEPSLTLRWWIGKTVISRKYNRLDRMPVVEAKCEPIATTIVIRIQWIKSNSSCYSRKTGRWWWLSVSLWIERQLSCEEPIMRTIPLKWNQAVSAPWTSSHLLTQPPEPPQLCDAKGNLSNLSRAAPLYIKWKMRAALARHESQW